jgi:glutamine amidotransferase
MLSVTKYGHNFTSVINKENIFGTQFHPEKSHQYGIKILKNFIDI